MPMLKFWTTEVEANTDVTGLSNGMLLAYLQDLVAEDVYNNGGSLHPESDLGKFYWRVYNELIKRLNYYPSVFELIEIMDSREE